MGVLLPVLHGQPLPGLTQQHAYSPVVLAGVLLYQLQPVLLRKQHESVHGSLGAIRISRLFASRRHRRAHHDIIAAVAAAAASGRAHSGGKEVGDAVSEGGRSAGAARARTPGRGGQLVREIMAGNKKQV